jgi:PII-like signaling protein
MLLERRDAEGEAPIALGCQAAPHSTQVFYRPLPPLEIRVLLAFTTGLSNVICLISVWVGHLVAVNLNAMNGCDMQVPRDAVLLRIFFGEDDRFKHRPLHEAIVLKAREMHLAGATVLRGHVGFGHSSHLHTTKILRLSGDLPIIVEIVDGREKIDLFLPVLDDMMSSGLVTIEKVQVLQYGSDSIRAPDEAKRSDG